MKKMDKSKMLQIPEVVEEIKRHLWIESEKAGRDIGFDAAADNWIENYSCAWLEHYMPEKCCAPKKTAIVKKTAKKRSAKSYGK